MQNYYEKIKELLGHGIGNRQVVIKRNGTIHYYGSTINFDRQNDYWHFVGNANDIIAKLEQIDIYR
jgi:hypothetical protein